jgi:hypothetical protein
MPPRTRQARNLNHASRGMNKTSLGDDSTHASIVNQVGVEAQPAVNLTHPQNNANSVSTITISEIDHTLIKPRKTHLFCP